MVKNSFAVSSSERFLLALLELDDDDLESEFPPLAFCSEGGFLSEAPVVVWEEDREESRAPEGVEEDDDDDEDDTDGGVGDGLRLRSRPRLPLLRDDDDDGANFGLRLRFKEDEPLPPLNTGGDLE